MKLHMGDLYYDKRDNNTGTYELDAIDEETHVVSLRNHTSWITEEIALGDFLANYELMFEAVTPENANG